jgi:hypothetical protein
MMLVHFYIAYAFYFLQPCFSNELRPILICKPEKTKGKIPMRFDNCISALEEL